MEYSGEILGIIYQNELNSYTIAEMYIDELEDVKTIVGYLPFVVEGDNLKIVGNFVEHKEYGEQFKVESFEKVMPQTLDALERYYNIDRYMLTGINWESGYKLLPVDYESGKEPSQFPNSTLIGESNIGSFIA